MLKRIGFASFLIAAHLSFLTFCPVPSHAATQVQTFIEFFGEMVDQNALAISAVLPLEFRIYATANAKKALATEHHFVSVVDGKYSLTLGETAEISATNSSLYVAVFLDGKELTRQEVNTKRHFVDTKVVSKVTKTNALTLSDTPNRDFKLTCPNGYVVTGIEGKTTDGHLSSIQLICSNTF